MTDHPWPAGAATSIGSLPGTDPVEAARLVFGELPDLPFLPELPARGVEAEMVGRAVALLIDLPAEIGSAGWQLTTHPGRELRRARDFLARDLDALEQLADGYSGALKLQLAGPWTLAAAIELPSGHKVVSDHGASRELAESLAEGLRAHLADVAARVPGAHLVVQVDEPSLAAVLAGHVATPSGYGTVRAVGDRTAESGLQTVLGAAPAGARVVHCCAADVPLAVIRAAGADAVSLDLAQLGTDDYDSLAEAVDAGLSLWLGVLPSTDADRPAARARLDRLWRELGLAADQLATSVVPTTACGLASASPAYVRRAFTALRELGRDLLES